VLSLGAVHSFALEEVVHYLHSNTVRDVLTQAVLDAPLFGVYWRWNASTALAVRRFRNGKKQPAQFQRMDAEDLLSTVFPDQLACAENLAGGDREIPDHPLVKQTLDDCLTAAMDIDGLEEVLRRIEAGEIEVICRELTSPSPLAQEILGAKPYAFLDDAPAEERRTLAVQARRYMTPEQAAELGKLDADAIARVREEAWPQPLNADELHDALVLLGFVAASKAAGPDVRDARRWPRTAVELPRPNCVGAGAVARGRRPSCAVAAERLAVIGGAVEDRDTALRELVRSRFEALGPVTAEALAQPFGLTAADVLPALAALEQQGTAMRGNFTGAPGEEWCERRLLARIHRYTLKRLPDRARDAVGFQLPVPLAVWRERRQGRGLAPCPASCKVGIAGCGLGARGAGAHRGLPALLLDQPSAGGSFGGGRARAAHSPVRAPRPSRRRQSLSCRAGCCRCGARSARSSPCKACRAPPSASSRCCASAARCSSSRSFKRAASCAYKSRRRSASSSRAAS
jgi:hypothetical protein